jgi:hypothetical protein
MIADLNPGPISILTCFETKAMNPAAFAGGSVWGNVQIVGRLFDSWRLLV